jgi:hypothetical protein
VKKYFTLLAFAVSVSSYAQIVISNTDMPVAGWTHRTVKDTTPGVVNFGNKGANQIYDFSNLTGMVYDTIYYNALSAAQQTKFPNANVVVTADSVNFLYTRTTNAKFDWEGVEFPLGGILTAFNFSPVNDIYRFPTQYNGNYSSSWGYQKAMPGSQIGQPAIYEFRITHTATFYDTIDGWGKTITPIGAYKSLRQKRKEYSRTVVDYKLFAFSSYTLYSDTRDTTVRYTYPAKETKGSIVIFDYDSSDNVTAITYSLIPPAAPVAAFNFGNGTV